MTPKMTIGIICMIAGISAGTETDTDTPERTFDLNQYNPVWTTQSTNSQESMPCGGGDTGLNVWVEDGDILFYMSRSGTFDENNTMLKLGRIRIKLTPNPFSEGSRFRQELILSEGCIDITGDSNEFGKTTAKIWVEVHRPIIHIELNSDRNIEAVAVYENWRTQDHPLTVNDRMQCLDYFRTRPDVIELFTAKDTFKQGKSEMLWYHRNRDTNTVFDNVITQQHLESIKSRMANPIKNRTFGGIMRGEGFVSDGTANGSYLGTPFTGWRFKSRKPAKSHLIEIFLSSKQEASLEKWENDLRATADKRIPREETWAKNVAWWKAFWERSHVAINQESCDPDDKPWQVGRNYQLFRYQLGCNAYGEYPSKFNGSLFTYDPCLIKNKYRDSTPDFRQWGGGSFTAQNQRLLYWPMLKSGDFDMLPPQFEFYMRGLENAELRTKHYWGHDGASFAEQLSNFGLPVGEIYEAQWGKKGLGPRPDNRSVRTLKNLKGETTTIMDRGFLKNNWVMDHYDTVLEFCMMILDTHRFAGVDVAKYIPLLHSSITFLDQHYQYWSRKLNGFPLDEEGKLIIYPSTACETYKLATNPSNQVAGMRAVLTRMLNMPDSFGTNEQRKYWEDVLARVPEISFREKEGKRVISPAKDWARINNVELPFLYPVFPWNIYGVGKPDLQVAIDTWRFGHDKENQRNIVSWHQDAIFCARLGLTDEAADLTISKMKDAPRRYPTYWGPGHDWVPDHNWGGSGMIGVQEMLMHTTDKEIRLLPAWPREWDVSFKLNAPYKTTIEAVVKNGKLESLKVSPETRKEDIVIAPEWQ